MGRIIQEPIRFPEDFSRSMHPNIPGATRWTYPKTGDTVISVVGGGFGLHGDGVVTFEMYDFREDGPQDYLTQEEINAHLEVYPV
jgi:hypothetical protein